MMHKRIYVRLQSKSYASTVQLDMDKLSGFEVQVTNRIQFDIDTWMVHDFLYPKNRSEPEPNPKITGIRKYPEV